MGALGSAPNWSLVLSQLLSGVDLTTAQAKWAMAEMMSGAAEPAQVAGFLVGLRAKGESVAELTGLVEVMLAQAIPLPDLRDSIDIVGTGGDQSHTVNISTMAALVVAGTGRMVVKHGNRAASSSCGSADVLQELGVRLDLTPERSAEVARSAKITFCFAQVYHPAMRAVAATRRQLGVPTAFNFLGPLTNPAQPVASAIGVGDARMAPLLAGVMAARGRAALVFRGEDGLDELTLAGSSTLWVVAGGQVRVTGLNPQQLGLELAPISALQGGDPAFNAQVVRQVLAGEPGPVRSAVVLNAAAGLVAESLAAQQNPPSDSQILEQFEHGLRLATEAIDSGRAAQVLTEWVAQTQG